MRHLFTNWEQVALRLSEARTIALFLDFDGTLARLRLRPDDVRFGREPRRFLMKLATSSRFRVWVISGRRRDDVQSHVCVPGIRYLGLHGWEGRSTSELYKTTRIALAAVKQRVSELEGHQDIWIEDKGATIAFHYRTAAARMDLQQVLSEAVLPFHSLLRLSRSKNVIEAVPWEIEDKGEAVRRQMANIRNSTVPVYVGDDFIDEPAFRALSYGITVHVGRMRQTRAKYWLPDVLQVHALLRKLAVEFS